jgi:hypothetical protein
MKRDSNDNAFPRRPRVGEQVHALLSSFGDLSALSEFPPVLSLWCSETDPLSMGLAAAFR